MSGRYVEGHITRNSRGECRVWISLSETDCYDLAAKYRHDDLFAEDLHKYAAELHDLATAEEPA